MHVVSFQGSTFGAWLGLQGVVETQLLRLVKAQGGGTDCLKTEVDSCPKRHPHFTSHAAGDVLIIAFGPAALGPPYPGTWLMNYAL